MSGTVKGWCLTFDPVIWGKRYRLDGFDSMFDAWAFAFAALSVDASSRASPRMWTNKPKKPRADQLSLF